MKRCRVWLVIVGLACAQFGCLPRRLFWSPDGQRAAVVGTEGIYLTDTDGHLSKLVAPHGMLAAWLPDSKRFVAVTVEPAKNWNEVESVLNAEQKGRLSGLAAGLRSEILAYQGDWKQFQPSAARHTSGGELLALLLYLRAQDDGQLSKKLAEQWSNSDALAAAICRLQVFEVAEGGGKPGALLASWVDTVADLRVSPNGRLAAVTIPTGPNSDNALYRLLVVPVAGGAEPTLVAEHVAAFPDWSPDGRHLYYGMTRSRPVDGQDAFSLGTLTRRPVADESGNLHAAPPEAEDIVGLMFWHQMKVRCLKDGRILFSSGEVTLPATKSEMPQEPSLFFIDPDRQPTVTRILPKQPDTSIEGLGVGAFELSPDEKQIAVIGGGNKQISLITLATGKVETLLAPDGSEQELQSVPAWRTPQELSVVVPPGRAGCAAGRSGVVLLPLNGDARCISKDWPDVFAEPKQ